MNETYDRVFIINYGNMPYVAIKWNGPWTEDLILDWYAKTYDMNRINLSLWFQRPIDLIEGPK